MTAYQWDELRIRERVEALGLTLAINLDRPEHFRVLDAEFDRLAVVVATAHGFEAITAGDPEQYFPVSTSASENTFFEHLTALAAPVAVPE